MKIGDLLILNENVELEDSDWKDVGWIDDWQKSLIGLNGIFKVTDLTTIYPEHVKLQNSFWYPKKLFKQYSNTYELW